MQTRHRRPFWVMHLTLPFSTSLGDQSEPGTKIIFAIISPILKIIVIFTQTDLLIYANIRKHEQKTLTIVHKFAY